MLILADIKPAAAQGTAFKYQGQLGDIGSPANGVYDLEFTLFDAATNGNLIAGALTNAATSVTNGLFTVTLDFGPVFNGSNFWLQIAVRTNGADAFTSLNPAQPLSPVPYAIYAANAASAASFNGLVPGGSLSGAYSGALELTNAANQFGGSFAGNGAGLTNLNFSGAWPTSAVATFVSVLQAGVVNDGVTDNTAALLRLLNQPGSAWYFPSGRYLSQELQVTNNVTLFGNGATLVYASGAANNNIFVREMLNTNIVIDGIALDGGDYSDITTRTWVGTYGQVLNFALDGQHAGAFNYWRPLGYRHGLQINATGGGRVRVTVSGFGGCAIIPLATNNAVPPQSFFGPFWNPNMVDVSGTTCYNNFVGFYSSAMLGYQLSDGAPNWITNYVPNSANAQYVQYRGLNLWGNTIGAVNGAANNAFIGCNFNANYFHELNNGNANDYHGSCIGNFYNHGLYCAIFSTACQHGGQIYSGCWFGGNSGSIGPCPIILYACFGVSFRDCHFDSLCITNEYSPAGGLNFLQNCTYSGTWAGNVLFASDGQLLYEGNMSYDHAGDTDGSALSLLRLGGNGGGVTNLSASAITGGLTSNMAVLVPGGVTNTLCFTNGVLTAIKSN
jgi:hypothetical protein